MEKILAVLDYFELLLLIFHKEEIAITNLLYFKCFQKSSPFQVKMVEFALIFFCSFSQQISLSVWLWQP